MQTRIAFSIVMLLGMLTGVSAQNFNDALRYSNFQPLGTARFIGAGSALGPLGADYSVMSTNPAGIAWLRRSEFSFTPGQYITSRKSSLVNGSGNRDFTDRASRFTFPQAGLVIAGGGGYNFRTFNFGIGINRLADFNEDVFYRGNSSGSILDRFVEQANSSIGLDDFEAGLAFDAEALLQDNNGLYFSDFENAANAVIQREQQVERSGSITELSFGMGGNFRERVLWGLSVGIPIVKYTEEKTYSETDVNGEVPFFDNLSFTENLTTTGAGANLKLGVIVRANQGLRFSLAVHTPTAYQLSDTFSTAMVYNYTFKGSAEQGEATSPDGSFQYNLRTPWRFMGGVGRVFDRTGFLSAELEYVNYGNNAFGYDDFPEDEARVNGTITDNLGSAINLRVGGEYNVSDFPTLRIGEEYAIKNLALRGGITAQSNIEQTDEDGLGFTYSAGMGIRGRAVFLDLAYRLQGQGYTYVPYNTVVAPRQEVTVDGATHLATVTLGFRF